VPFAPGLVSTTILCLSATPSGSAMLRATLSVALPGPNGTTIVIGRDGYVCAPAICDTAGVAAAPATRCRNARRRNRMAPSRSAQGWQRGFGTSRCSTTSNLAQPAADAKGGAGTVAASLSCLLRLDLGVSDHLAPGFELDLDALSERRRRAFDRVKV